MKKAMVLLLVLVIGVFMLAGCGEEPQVLTGRYYFVSMSEGGEVVTAEDFAVLGIEIEDLYLEFQENGRFKMVLTGLAEAEEGTYKVSDQTITLTVDGSPATGTIEGNRITITEDDMTMVFEKK